MNGLGGGGGSGGNMPDKMKGAGTPQPAASAPTQPGKAAGGGGPGSRPHSVGSAAASQSRADQVDQSEVLLCFVSANQE